MFHQTTFREVLFNSSLIGKIIDFYEYVYFDGLCSMNIVTLFVKRRRYEVKLFLSTGKRHNLNISC